MKQIKLKSLMISAAIALSPFTFAASQFEQGTHYDVIAPQVKTEPVVEEFFNYACGACFAIEKFSQEFKEKHPNIKFKYVPVELRPAWKIYVKAYFIGEKLGVLDKSHSKLFDRIHVDKKYFKDEDDMKAFFIELGVTEADYDKVADSYWVKTQMRQAKQYSFKAKVSSTPSFVVNKRYKINRTEMSTQQLEDSMVELSTGAGSN
ncbi:thiol:disulfide interchange protein DsbA/DsbL [Aliikangiella sp. G2MR2-5]|uniref:thiol:disulfide interchange protein DsbA/DsbL n=1 Tax=Aliikangiella sp. G2MR2-5 TaxID=2788943 RepID=UPI0018ABDDC7|nr:thiol:disulfide interchange protein DsbA/DsbL [Aliikangiella sp. G2MR2-5]